MCLNLEKSEFACGIRRAKAKTQVGLKTENVQMFSYACFICLVCQHLSEGNAFLLQICSPQCTGFTLYQGRAEKGWLMMCLIHFSHMLAPFVTSLMQTAGHKMAALMFMFFLQISNVDFFLTNKTGNQLKNTAFIFYFFLNCTHLDSAHVAASAPFPLKNVHF